MPTRLLLLLLGLLMPLLLWSCQDATRLELSQRVEVLVKDTVLYDHLWLDYDGISMFANAADKQHARPECKIYYAELETFVRLWDVYSTEEMLRIYQSKGVDVFDPAVVDRLKETRLEEQPNPGKSLSGMRIAIDPVHLGGGYPMAALEGKLLKLLRGPRDTLFVDEGALNLAVARILEAKLKKKGAQVHLTRRNPGGSALGKGFFLWLREDFKKDVARDRYAKAISEETARYLLEKADAPYIFNQYFKPKDQRARIAGINRFRPHATVMVQLNVHEPNWKRRDAKGAMPLGSENYSMAFVPGGFGAGELSTPLDRLEFLRLLASTHLDESVKLSRQALTAFRYKLNVLPVADESGLAYLRDFTNEVEPGIYARNLAMTRLIHGPLCYGEPLCLDSKQEAEALLKAEVKVGSDIVTSLRIEQIADAYLAALEEYLLRGEVPISEDDLVEEPL
jgi:N-acetylmuramoyl-L-alanine amidase